MRVLVVGFVCGVVAVLAFQQSTVFLLHHEFGWLRRIGVPEALRPPGPGYAMRLVPPLYVPHVVYLMFWGGLWGALLATLVDWLRMPTLLTGFVLGAVVCTIAGFTLVAGLHGTALPAGDTLWAWGRVALVNGAWGWGAAAMLKVYGLGRR